MSDTGDLWWKSAVIYCAHVETFYDSNGDGQGETPPATARMTCAAWARVELEPDGYGPPRAARPVP